MRRLLLVASAAVALACAGVARADGDPASDVLLYQNDYLPYAAPSKSAKDSLEQEIASVYAAGNRVKVAIVQARDDLGAIPSLYGKPTQYAQFLGQEISGVYIGPLLIVMPAGYGIYDGGRSVAAETSVLSGLDSPGTTSDDLSAAGTVALQKLEAADALSSPDILKPYTTPVQTKLKGLSLTVLFYLYDDSGRASATVSVVRGTRTTLASTTLRNHASSALHPASATVKLPRGFTKTAMTKVCITAVDASGNRAKACKKL